MRRHNLQDYRSTTRLLTTPLQTDALQIDYRPQTGFSIRFADGSRIATDRRHRGTTWLVRPDGSRRALVGDWEILNGRVVEWAVA